MKNQSQPKNRSRSKVSILGLIFVSVVINYMDRTNIAVAASAISADLELSKVQMGLIFSAFAWTYSTLQIPGGMIVDIVRVRILYPFILIAWSLATVAQGLVSSFAAMMGCRLAIGVFEAPSFPANNKIVTHWFPEQERAGAIAVYTSGQFIGLAFLMPVLALIQHHFGWRGLFIISGLIGILWAIVWYFVYRDPEEVQTEDTTRPIAKDQAPATWANLRIAFSNRKLWGIYIAQFCIGGTMIFFLTWFPTYLEETRGLSILKTGIIASIPYLAAFVGVLLSGFTSDLLIRKGFSKELSRKTPVIIGLLLSGSVIGANFAETTTGVIFFLSLSFFGSGLASIAWVFVSLLAPRQMVGVVGGCFNFVGGLSAVIVPMAVGFLARDGDFRPALVMISALAITGMLSYLFLVGRVEQIQVPSEQITAAT